MPRGSRRNVAIIGIIIIIKSGVAVKNGCLKWCVIILCVYTDEVLMQYSLRREVFKVAMKCSGREENRKDYCE